MDLEYEIKVSPALEDMLKKSKPEHFQIKAINNSTNEVLGSYRFNPPTKNDENTYTYTFSKFESNKSSKNIPKNLIYRACEVLQIIANNTKNDVIHRPFFKELKDKNIEKSQTLIKHFEDLGYRQIGLNKYEKKYERANSN